MSRGEHRFLKRAGLVAVSAALAFGGVELYARETFCQDTRLSSFWEVRHLYLGSPVAVYHLSDSDGKVRGLNSNTSTERASINSLGFRGPELQPEKPPGGTRIVCLGGSSVYGTANTSDSTTWPSWLSVIASRESSSAPVEVLNGGVPGFPARDSVSRFEDLFLPLDVDVAVLSNIYNGFVGARVRQLNIDPTQNVTRLGRGWLDRVLSHSAIYVRLRINQAWEQREEHHRKQIEERREEAGPTEEPANAHWASWLDSRVPNREAWFEREVAVSDDVNPYLVADDLIAFQKVLSRFIELAREHDVTPVLCTQPLGFALDPAMEVYPFRSTLQLLFPNSGDFCEAFGAFNDCIRQLAEEEQVPLFDADVFMPRKKDFFQDQVHLTDEGCRVYAQGLIGFLRESALLPAE